MTLNEVGHGCRLGLRERMATSEDLLTGLLARALSTPFVGKVPIQVSSRALPRNQPILTPESVYTVRVFVTIWINNREYVPVNILDMLSMFLSIFNQLVYDVCNRRWRDPLPSMNACE
jgi:hypothetical protein